MAVVEKSQCIFCNIVNKLEDTEILYEDDDVCVFRDIKPASDYHILTIPKRHIEDAKCLTANDKQLVERMFTVAKDLLLRNNLSLEDARFGYHWPPFRSVKHLHLHTIAPESKMGFIAKTVFMKNSYWFVSIVCIQVPKASISQKELRELWKNSGSKADEYRLKCACHETEKTTVINNEPDSVNNKLKSIQDSHKMLLRNIKVMKIYQISTMILTFLTAALGYFVYINKNNTQYCEA